MMTAQGYEGVALAGGGELEEEVAERHRISQMTAGRLDLTPQQRPAITRCEADRPRQATIKIAASGVRLRVITHLIAMRVELRGQDSRRRRLALVRALT